ncbi:uncharacterized protein FIBRA_04790 [Fibroporia radiculosa]|uniref:C2H2-type domain-containing protein n=1 Tax=Fibroporia radiculosa TaxID=599839 RepID=J4H355_9APHY|nr:uncharacterized protein FIBRA_04790 [Fibroporia radiculosa]CCM02684.1 predicted protein [Fibroporia radiculosa]
MSQVEASASSVAVDGLLSLSLAAASAAPILMKRDSAQEDLPTVDGSNGPSSSTSGGGSTGVGSKVHASHKYRRPSSAGQARRRLSEAREAASRPSPVTISAAAAALTSLAKLSLSGTPPPQTSTTLVSASGVMDSTTNSTKQEATETDPVGSELVVTGISVTNSKTGAGKKRGSIFKCESCSKVYRHPSCLIKHRWEHSPHWREASKFLLSKHQQVQMLEAAAILSHITPSATGGSSLPEDRSLWPSYLSGGLLPPPSQANTLSIRTAAIKPSMSTFSLEQPAPFPSSSSVPAPSVLVARSGPRMHDYAVPAVGGVTELRPGVLAVPNTGTSSHTPPVTDNGADTPAPQRSVPVPMPGAGANTHHHARDGGYSLVSAPSDAWSSPVSVGFASSSFRSSGASAIERSYSDGAGGWSLPRSSVRSSSRSRSGSEESEYVDVDGDGEDYNVAGRYGFSARSRKSEGVRSVNGGPEKIEEEWDGMEMEMEM